MKRNKIIPVVCIIAGFILTGLAAVAEGDGKEVITRLGRPAAGESEKEYEISFSYDGTENIISVGIGERQLDFSEAQELLDEGLSELELLLEEKNGQLSGVTGDLILPETVLDGIITVTWESRDREYIGDDGILNMESCMDIGESGRIVTMVARAVLQDYAAELEIPICISRDVLNEEERKIRIVEEAIGIADKNSAAENYVELPTKIGDEAIEYYRTNESSRWKYIVLGVMAAVGYVLAQKQKDIKTGKVRNEELQLAFAPIITKLTLLIGAGINIRGAWEKLVSDYKKEKKKNAAYEEMLKTYNEIQNGLSEGQAYVLFGKRCRLSSYVKLGNLLEQNLRKGTKGLSERLEHEVWEAFEDRKALAYRLGDEAGTKLLIPMIMSLGIIIVFCVAPAFLNM